MPKRINVNKLRAIAAGAASLIIVMIIAIPLWSGAEKETDTIDIQPGFAPAEYAYPEFFQDQQLSDGFSWRINENGIMEFKDADGNKYQIGSDGTVYRVNPDGSITPIEDVSSIADVLAAAEEAAENSSAASEALGSSISDRPLTDSEISEMFGSDADPDTIRELINNGMEADDIASLIDEGFTPEDIANALAEGVEPEDIHDYLRHEKEVYDRVADSLAGTGADVDDFIDYLESNGLTPEQYLAALAATGADEPSAPEIPSTASILKASDMPSLTINLNGDESAAERKEEDYLDALAAAGNPLDPTALASAIAGMNLQPSDYSVINDQQTKSDFMDSFSDNAGYDQLTKNDIAPGTVVTMLLKTGINSDLPGQIVAEVTQNVYDSLTGTVLLIPKGTRLIATYSSSVSWGQERALVAWTQLIRPDGLMVNLPGFSGIDGQGYTGYHDKVDRHIWDLIWGAGLASLLDVGTNEISYTLDEDGWGALGEVLGLYTDELSTAAQDWLKNVVNQQPTLRIRPGRTIKLLVTQKLTLKPYLL